MTRRRLTTRVMNAPLRGVQRFVEHFPETFLSMAPDRGQEDNVLLSLAKKQERQLLI